MPVPASWVLSKIWGFVWTSVSIAAKTASRRRDEPFEHSALTLPLPRGQLVEPPPPPGVGVGVGWGVTVVTGVRGRGGPASPAGADQEGEGPGDSDGCQGQRTTAEGHRTILFWQHPGKKTLRLAGAGGKPFSRAQAAPS